MSLAEYVRILGRGPGRSRSLTQQEALEAMTLMLSGQAAPEAVGALLMLLRMKGETPEEIAGFAKAAQNDVAPIEGVDLDWPSYAAGRTRGHPWFLAAALTVAQSGHNVLLHGWNGPDPKVRDGLDHYGIQIARSSNEASEILMSQGIAYLPLEHFHKPAFDLLNLRSVLGLRSCMNTVCRMLNPGGAKASLQGVFHPAYRDLQMAAAQHLGLDSLTIIKGGGGEFERHPGKSIQAAGLRDGQIWSETIPALTSDQRRLSETSAEAPGRFEQAIVSGTTALALQTLGVLPSSETEILGDVA